MQYDPGTAVTDAYGQKLMSALLATLVFVTGILSLFAFARIRNVESSRALWIPVVWLLITGSRAVSEWLVAAGFQSAATWVQSADAYLDGSPTDRNVFMVLLFAGVMVLIHRRREVAPLLGKNGPILLFFSYCALSILWSDYSFVAFKHWIKGIGDFVMIFVVLTDPKPEVALKRLLARVGFLLIPISVLFVKYYPDLGRTYNRWTWRLYVTGVTTNKNTLGMICLVFGLGFLWTFLCAYTSRGDPQRTRQLITHGALLGMVLWLLSIADSATSLACFLIAGSLLVLTHLTRITRKPSVLHLVVAIVIIVPLFALFLDSGGDLVQSVGRDPTLTGRREIWHVVEDLTANPLLGTGYESFWLGDRLQKIWSVMPGIQEAHNGYLEVFLNLGWIGIALLSMLIVTGYRNIMLALKRGEDAASLKLAYFVVGLVYSLSEAGFRMMLPVWFFFLFAVTYVRDAAVPEVSPFDDVNHQLSAWESQISHELGVGFCKENIEAV